MPEQVKYESTPGECLTLGGHQGSPCGRCGYERVGPPPLPRCSGCSGHYHTPDCPFALAQFVQRCAGVAPEVLSSLRVITYAVHEVRPPPPWPYTFSLPPEPDPEWFLNLLKDDA